MNKLKRVLSGTLALAMAASMMTACGKDDSSTGNGGGNGGGDSSKQTVHVYTFTDETQTMIDKYFLKDEKNKEFADKYQFEYHLTSDANEFIANCEAALTKTEEAPDLFVADADYAQRFAENAKTASLADLGIEINEPDYYTYTLDFTTVNGTRMGLSHQAAPGVVLYRTDYAEKYLGTKDPEEIQSKYLGSWDQFKATADTLKENGIPMISGVDELKRCFMNNRANAWVDADMNYTPDEAKIKELFEYTKSLSDAGEVHYIDKTQWTSNWYTDMQDGVFCFFGCTWFMHYTLKPNCVATKTGDKDKDGNPQAAEADYKVGNGSYGLWAAVPGPEPYFWGGTWWFGSKQCLDDGTKDVVKAIIEYFCVNDDSMKAYMEATGDFPSKKTVASQLSASNENLGGQDHYAIFKESAENVNVGTCCKYDATFNGNTDAALAAYCTGTKTLDEAIQSIYDESKTSIPELKEKK